MSKGFSCLKVDIIPGKIGNLIFKLYQDEALTLVLWIQIRRIRMCFGPPGS
jgi:hypothetical protein